MGRKSKVKGAVGERELAKLFKDNGIEAFRGRQYSGKDGSPDVDGIPYVHAEVKRVECMKIGSKLLEAALEQSEHDAIEEENKTGEEKIACVFFRQNNEKWKVAMRLSEFEEMISGRYIGDPKQYVVFPFESWFSVYKEWSYGRNA